MSSSLSAKHLRFCQYVASGYNQSESYIKAGYSPTAANANAARLTAKDSISSEIARLKVLASHKSEVTIESMIADMETLYDMAVDKGDVNAAIKAKSEQSKLVGLYAPIKTDNKTTVKGSMAVNTNQLGDEVIQDLMVKKQQERDAITH